MKKKTIIKILLVLVALGVIVGIGVIAANAHIKSVTKDFIIPESELKDLEDIDCILVLGCGVWDDGTPTDMLADRIKVGIRTYETGVSDRLLMSGDHSRKDYDEVNTMKAIAVESGIPADNVFCDHAGFSTYESMYRASDIFGADKIVIVTQSYHLPRAIYNAQKLGIEAYGISADERTYMGQIYRDARELLARAKDFVWCIIQPEPTFRGEKIPITASGSLTDG